MRSTDNDAESLMLSEMSCRASSEEDLDRFQPLENVGDVPEGAVSNEYAKYAENFDDASVSRALAFAEDLINEQLLNLIRSNKGKLQKGPSQSLNQPDGKLDNPKLPGNIDNFRMSAGPSLQAALDTFGGQRRNGNDIVVPTPRKPVLQHQESIYDNLPSQKIQRKKRVRNRNSVDRSDLSIENEPANPPKPSRLPAFVPASPESHPNWANPPKPPVLPVLPVA